MTWIITSGCDREATPAAGSTPGTAVRVKSKAQPLDLNNLPKTMAGVAGIELVLIPAGEFTMGEAGGEPDEQPAHRVTISQPFYLGKYEVTQAQWKQIMGNNPSKFVGDDLPVDSVSWKDVQTFLQRLNDADDPFFYRLPTEAEWEYACRAGGSGKYAGNPDATAWYFDNAGGRTHPVGRKEPNAFGLYDMHGNVREWCQDWYDDLYYKKTPGEDPTGPTNGTWRAIRGGSYFANAAACRSAVRYKLDPELKLDSVGFRVAASVR
ncbi:formylglycine-generating enzyme family protein [Chloracidobacterium sp. MS 40/45]|nr:formylglycine-generating enzyme family protein [Chloracidobacterium sp. MS 40/45]